jgi:hypothetical protein
VFHERTHLSLPAAAYNALFAAIPRLLSTEGAGALGTLPMAVGGKSGAIGRPPPLPSRYYARRAVLTEIERRLAEYPVLVLQGGTGATLYAV